MAYSLPDRLDHHGDAQDYVAEWLYGSLAVIQAADLDVPSDPPPFPSSGELDAAIANL